jgi:hypothetical protein
MNSSLINGQSASVVRDYRNRPPPMPNPHGYPIACIDNELLLRCFPDPWLYECDFAFRTPPHKVVKNVDLIDVSTHIIDDLDHSKRFKFQVENVSINTTRTITIPDEDFTLITPSSNVTLTNKTIVGNTNTVGATQLETSGVAVQITGSAPPGANYVLVTTNSNTATWQHFSGGGGGGGAGKIAYTLNNGKFMATPTSYTSISTFSWIQARYLGYLNGIVIFHATITDRNLDVKLRNITAGVDLGSITNISATGVYTFNILAPTMNAHLELQIRKTLSGGASPVIEGVSLEFDQV